MKTIQIVLPDAALRAADREARREKINRSALFRKALDHYLRRRELAEMEVRHRRGYEENPVEPGEFDVWDGASAWPSK